MNRIHIIPALLLTACPFVSEGAPMDTDASSSSSGSDDDESDTTVSTTLTTNATSTTTESSTSESSESTESSGDDDASSDSGSSSGGDKVVYYALAFDGGLAITPETDIVEFDGENFTIEMWIRRDGDIVEGVFFDTTVTVSGPNGLTLVQDLGWTSSDDAVFYDFGADPAFEMEAFDLSSMSPSWHHVAVVRNSDEIIVWVDGSQISVILASETDNAPASVAIGTQPTTPFVPLRGLVVDELRISNTALYTTPFEPSYPLGTDGAALYWSFDEGQGEVAVDEIQGMSMDLIGGVSWIVAD